MLGFNQHSFGASGSFSHTDFGPPKFNHKYSITGSYLNNMVPTTLPRKQTSQIVKNDEKTSDPCEVQSISFETKAQKKVLKESP